MQLQHEPGRRGRRQYRLACDHDHGARRSLRARDRTRTERIPRDDHVIANDLRTRHGHLHRERATGHDRRSDRRHRLCGRGHGKPRCDHRGRDGERDRDVQQRLGERRPSLGRVTTRQQAERIQFGSAHGYRRYGAGHIPLGNGTSDSTVANPNDITLDAKGGIWIGQRRRHAPILLGRKTRIHWQSDRHAGPSSARRP